MTSRQNSADTVSCFVGASLIAGRTVKEIVADLDEQLAVIRRDFAISSVSVLTSPHYSMLKAAADCLRNRR